VKGSMVQSSATVEGGGEGFSTVSTPLLSTEVGAPAPSFGLQETYVEALNSEGGKDELAGDHPTALNTGFAANTVSAPSGERVVTSGGIFKQVSFTLPLGLIGDPQALEKCPATDLLKKRSEEEEEKGITEVSRCPIASRVGAVVVEGVGGSAIERSGGVNHEISYIYNMVPEKGFAAEFGFVYLKHAITLYATVIRTPQGYAIKVSGFVPDIFEIGGTYLTMFGDPAAVNGQATGGQSAAFLRNPTTCGSGVLSATAEAESWEEPGVVKTAPPTPVYPHGLSGCDALQFNPAIEARPLGSSARLPDAPAGYEVALKVPQAPNLMGVPATSDLRNATVTLPAGVALSPPSGAGLQGCTPDQFDVESTTAAACPEASQVGEAELRTPLLEESLQPLRGEVYVAQPECGPCSAADAQDGRLLHLYVQVKGPGFDLKLMGTGKLDPGTGQVTTSFGENPQLPFTEFKLRLHGGQRAPLATPQACGTFTTTSVLEPWSDETPSVTPSSVFTIGEDCTDPFAPSFTAGTSTPLAGEYSPFTLTLSRQDREQDLSGLSTTLPVGLLAAISHVSLCPEPLAAQGACPEASRIGTVHAAAGSGSEPLWETGSVYLTGPYNGAPFGLSVVVPAVAGPFNLGNVVVQAGIHIDPHTAAVTVVSNPFPQLVDGIPLRLKTLNVTLDRPGFTLNPTSCTPKAITGTVTSAQGATVGVSSPFDVAGCQNLPFKPTFSASSAGKTSKANGASLVVKVTSGTGQANIGKVAVDLPKQLPSRLTTLQKACTEGQFNTNPAGCPAASLVGTAVAHTPILNSPLTGPAYLVSHGGAAFPDLEILLQGEGVVLDLDGNTDIKKGITSSTFNSVPDAPISSFEVTLPENSHSALATDIPASAKNSLCGQSLTMPTTITGQNGAVLTQSTKIAVTGCAKVKAKALTRAQKLAKALKVCKKDKKKSKRAKCVKQARKKYGPVKSKKKGKK
jgi:hypothetical protein